MPPPEPPQLADWLRKSMQRRGLSHEAAADLLTVSRQAVSNWLKGTRPHPRHVARIREKLTDETEPLPAELLDDQNAQLGSNDTLIADQAVTYINTLRAASQLYDPIVHAYEDIRRDGENRVAFARDKLKELSGRWHKQVRDIQETVLQRKHLPTSTSSPKHVAMRIPNLNELLSEVRSMTTGAGARKALAESIGVSQPQLSRWLSLQRDTAYSPSAANALKLLNWVTQKREATKNENPEGALTPPGPVTQRRKPREEKPKSGQKKSSHKRSKKTTEKRR